MLRGASRYPGQSGPGGEYVADTIGCGCRSAGTPGIAGAHAGAGDGLCYGGLGADTLDGGKTTDANNVDNVDVLISI